LFIGKALYQKPESPRTGGVSVDTEEHESPSKRARQDFLSEEERSNFAVPQLSSYSEKGYKGKKVIAIVCNQSDVEGKIGGHDRRFGGSEKEDNKAKSRDDESCDLDYDDPDVTRIIGVDSEVNSQAFLEAKCEKKSSPGTCSSSVVVNVGNPSKTYTHCKPHHTKKNNCAIKHNSIMSEQKCMDNLDEILPFSEENSVSEQAHIEKMIKQEQEDYELALRLQQEWEKVDNVVDRSKGSLRAYELRNSNKSCKTKKKPLARKSGKGRQSTLEESFTGALCSSRRW
jgi:hypothetical protein